MGAIRSNLVERVLRKLNIRFPALFAIFLALTVFDVIVPDFVPFVDEILLALLTALFALWKKRLEPPNPTGS